MDQSGRYTTQSRSLQLRFKTYTGKRSVHAVLSKDRPHAMSEKNPLRAQGRGIRGNAVRGTVVAIVVYREQIVS